MSVSTVTTPRLSSRTRAADVMSRLLRNAAATPMPTSQRPSRVLPGLRIALAPAEAIGADAQAFDELPLREAPLGVFGIDLGVVENAKLDRDRARASRPFRRWRSPAPSCPAPRPARAWRCLRADRAPQAASRSCGWRRRRAAASGRRRSPVRRPADRRTSSRGRWR